MTLAMVPFCVHAPLYGYGMCCSRKARIAETATVAVGCSPLDFRLKRGFALNRAVNNSQGHGTQ